MRDLRLLQGEMNRITHGNRIWICAVVAAVMVFCVAGCGSGDGKSGDGDLLGGLNVDRFEVTSDDLHDDVWDTVITDTDYGENVSPQLSWMTVDGASCYVIYMVDTDAWNWMHWKSAGVTDNSLLQGWAATDEYRGPYPPKGTHHYEIYVIALKQDVSEIDGKFDAMNTGFVGDVEKLDEPAGNILAYGRIVGTYTHGAR